MATFTVIDRGKADYEFTKMIMSFVTLVVEREV